MNKRIIIFSFFTFLFNSTFSSNKLIEEIHDYCSSVYLCRDIYNLKGYISLNKESTFDENEIKSTYFFFILDSILKTTKYGETAYSDTNSNSISNPNSNPNMYGFSTFNSILWQMNIDFNNMTLFDKKEIVYRLILLNNYYSTNGNGVCSINEDRIFDDETKQFICVCQRGKICDQSTLNSTTTLEIIVYLLIILVLIYVLFSGFSLLCN